MNNSGTRSGQTSANNSNRPSKNSNQEDKCSTGYNNDSEIFEKAANILNTLN